MKETFHSKFSIGDHVVIDGDHDIVAVVVGVMFSNEKPEVQVSWTHNGDLKTYWVQPWRLKEVERD